MVRVNVTYTLDGMATVFAGTLLAEGNARAQVLAAMGRYIALERIGTVSIRRTQP